MPLPRRSELFEFEFDEELALEFEDRLELEFEELFELELDDELEELFPARMTWPCSADTKRSPPGIGYMATPASAAVIPSPSAIAPIVPSTLRFMALSFTFERLDCTLSWETFRNIVYSVERMILTIFS